MQDQRCLYCRCQRLSEIRLESVPYKYHEDHIAAKKRKNSLCQYNLVHKFIPMPHALKNTRCKGSHGERMRKTWRKYRHGSWLKSETKKRWSMKQGMMEEKFILRHYRIFVISRVRSWSQNFRSTKAELYSDVTWWKSIHVHTHTEQRSSASQLTAAINSRKSHGHYIKTTGRRTSSRRNIHFFTSQNRRCTNVIENSKVRMSRYLDTSTKAQKAKIMIQYGRSGRFSWMEKGDSRKLYWNMFEKRFRIEKAYLEHQSDLECTSERCFFFGRADIVPWLCVFGLHSKTMSNKQGYFE